MVDTAVKANGAPGPLQTGEVNKNHISAASATVSRKPSEEGKNESLIANGNAAKANGGSAELIVLDDDVVVEEPSPSKKRKLDEEVSVKPNDGIEAAGKLTVKKVRIEPMAATTKSSRNDGGLDNVEDSGDPCGGPLKKIPNTGDIDKSQSSSPSDAKCNKTEMEKVIRHLSKEELEQIVLEQICLAITQNGATKQMAKKLESAEARVDLYKNRAEVLQKQVHDLKTVIQRLINRMRTRNEQNAPKVVRGVGVQVTMNDSLESLSGSKVLVRAVSESSPVVSATGVLGQTGTPTTLQPVKLVTSPRIASYVPEQSIPRYRIRSGTQEAPVGSVIVLQTAVTTETTTKVNGVPANQKTSQVESPVKNPTIALNRKDIAANQRPVSSLPNHVVAVVATPAVTTVNKVMLPTMQPKVIDLTDDEQDNGQSKPKASSKPAERPQNSIVAARSAPQNVITTNMISSTSPANGKVVATNAVISSEKAAGGAQNGDSRQLASAKPPRAIVPMLPNTTHPPHPSGKTVPPRPHLTVSLVTDGTGIVLKWNMTLTNQHAKVVAYQLYAYQEGTAQHGTSPWRKISDIKALPLPMACTLTQFHVGNRYHFMVRAVDEFSRTGPYSEVKHIMLPTSASGEQN